DWITAQMLASAVEAFGYQVTVAENGDQAYEYIRTGEFRLVVTDWEMPGLTGIDLCRKVRSRSTGGYVYIIVLTSLSGVKNIVRGLEAGADDYLTKPFQPEELCVRLKVGERVLSLESRDMMIFALAKLAESRDAETGEHLERMREYCRIVGEELSTRPKYRDVVDGEYVAQLYLTSPLHDIGKVGIPDRILLKPGKLTPEEFEIMKQHTILGGQTLDAVAANHPEATFLQMARDIALTHHERMDGRGYPHGLKGDEIPLCGRIAALADVYDALTSKRVYKDEFDHTTARDILIKDSGTHFDPEVVDAFLCREEQFLQVKQRFRNPEPCLEQATETPLLVTV
ncbi:MAG: response regulator, partial [Planctomycetaceae bacterium]|nr:response regulator [Planctomycetaceae bacterium]